MNFRHEKWEIEELEKEKQRAEMKVKKNGYYQNLKKSGEHFLDL